MAVIPSQAGQIPIYVEQGSKTGTANSVTEHWDTGARFEINGVPTCLAVKQTVAPGASTVCTVTLQAQDLNGVNLAGVYLVPFYLSDSSAGAGYSAHVPTGGIAVTTGTTVLTRGPVVNLAASLTPAAVGAATCAEQTLAFAGVLATDIPLSVIKPTAQAGLGIAGVRIPSAGNVAINFVNPTAAPITPTPAESYTLNLLRVGLTLDVLTNASGTIVFTITDTARTPYFIVTEVPGTGLLSVATQLITANYG